MTETKEQITETAQEAKDLMVKLLPPLEYGENEDCDVLYQLIEELEQAALSTLQPTTGMKWVKASERLPESRKLIFIRLGKSIMLVGDYTNGKFRDFPDKVEIRNIDAVEWLDESPTTTPSPDWEAKAKQFEKERNSLLEFFDLLLKDPKTAMNRLKNANNTIREILQPYDKEAADESHAFQAGLYTSPKTLK